MEDEPLVRMAAVGVFESHGYAVLEASNSTEALLLLEHRADVWTLFSDIDMPGGISGLALAHEVSRRCPDAHIILTSGMVFPLGGAMPNNGQFIGKPYSIDDVSTRIDGFYAEDNAPQDNAPPLAA